MNEIFVRPAVPEDAQKFTSWLASTPNNLYDPDVPKYPSSFTLAAATKDKVIMYLPIQHPIMLESLAINPEATRLETGLALKELTKAAFFQAVVRKCGEMYFVCRDEATAEFAVRHGYEELPWKLYRRKISEIK